MKFKISKITKNYKVRNKFLKKQQNYNKNQSILCSVLKNCPIRIQLNYCSLCIIIMLMKKSCAVRES